MKRMTINRASAVSLLMAAAFLSRNNDIKVAETDKDGTSFASKFAEEYPNENLDNNFALQLLDSEDGRGDDLARGILGLHHELNYDSQVELAAVFNGDKAAIKRVSDAGKTINSYLASPSHEREVTESRDNYIMEVQNSLNETDENRVKSQGGQIGPDASDTDGTAPKGDVEGPVTSVNPTGEDVAGPKTDVSAKGQSDEGKEGDIEDDTKKQ